MLNTVPMFLKSPTLPVGESPVTPGAVKSAVDTHGQFATLMQQQADQHAASLRLAEQRSQAPREASAAPPSEKRPAATRQHSADTAPRPAEHSASAQAAPASAQASAGGQPADAQQAGPDDGQPVAADSKPAPAGQAAPEPDSPLPGERSAIQAAIESALLAPAEGTPAQALPEGLSQPGNPLVTGHATRNRASPTSTLANATGLSATTALADAPDDSGLDATATDDTRATLVPEQLDPALMQPWLQGQALVAGLAAPLHTHAAHVSDGQAAADTSTTALAADGLRRRAAAAPGKAPADARPTTEARALAAGQASRPAATSDTDQTLAAELPQQAGAAAADADADAAWQAQAQAPTGSADTALAGTPTDVSLAAAALSTQGAAVSTAAANIADADPSQGLAATAPRGRATSTEAANVASTHGDARADRRVAAEPAAASARRAGATDSTMQQTEPGTAQTRRRGADAIAAGDDSPGQASARASSADAPATAGTPSLETDAGRDNARQGRPGDDAPANSQRLAEGLVAHKSDAMDKAASRLDDMAHALEGVGAVNGAGHGAQAASSLANANLPATAGLAPANAPGAHSTPAPQAEARIPVPLNSPAFAPALGAQITVFARDGVQTAQLHLNPADMGPILVNIAVDGQSAKVDFQAERAATRDVIEASLPALAGALQDAGLTLTGGGVSQQPSQQGRQPQPEAGQMAQASGSRGRDIDPAAALPAAARPQRGNRGLVDLIA